MTDEKLREAKNARTMAAIELAKKVGIGNAIKIVDSGDFNFTTGKYEGDDKELLRLLNMKSEGGRAGYQTGGITETRTLPPEYVEALGKTYAADLTRQAGIPSITTATAQQPGETAEQFAQRQAQAQQFGITKAGMAELAPQVAAQDALQAAAYTQATDPST